MASSRTQRERPVPRSSARITPSDSDPVLDVATTTPAEVTSGEALASPPGSAVHRRLPSAGFRATNFPSSNETTTSSESPPGRSPLRAFVSNLHTRSNGCGAPAAAAFFRAPPAWGTSASTMMSNQFMNIDLEPRPRSAWILWSGRSRGNTLHRERCFGKVKRSLIIRRL